MNGVQHSYLSNTYKSAGGLVIDYCQDDGETNYSSGTQDSDTSNEDCLVPTVFTDAICASSSPSSSSLCLSSLSPSSTSSPSSPLSPTPNDYDDIMCNNSNNISSSNSNQINFNNNNNNNNNNNRYNDDKSLFTATNKRNKTIYVSNEYPGDFYNILPTVFKYPIFNGNLVDTYSGNNNSTSNSITIMDHNDNSSSSNNSNSMGYSSDSPLDYSENSNSGLSSDESSDDSSVVKLSSILNRHRKYSCSSFGCDIEDGDRGNSFDGGSLPGPSFADSIINKHTTSSATTTTAAASTTLRFPFNKKAFNKSGYSCHWCDCTEQLPTTTKLLEHLQSKHVIPQTFKESFVCLWKGCKVYNHPSCSRLWLERHVINHGGTRPFKCIIEGCSALRFSSHFMLERHINRHFKKLDTSNSPDTVAAPKLIRRNGQKLRYRRQPFSVHARTDVFDVGIMLQLQYLLVEMSKNCERISLDVMSSKTFLHITFHPKVIGCRVDLNDEVKYLVRWCPYNILEDEWLSQPEVNKKKSVPLWKLPPKVQEPFWDAVFPHKRVKPSHQSRKYKIR